MSDPILALLQSPDPIDKAMALKSSAVEPHHLRIALMDPATKHLAATHPKLTPELIREFEHDPELAEHLQNHSNYDHLAKNIGFITYPKLGQHSIYQRPMERKNWSNFNKLTGNNLKPRDLGAVAHWAKRNSPIGNRARMPAAVKASAPFDTSDHEAQHTVYTRLAAKHGINAMDRVVSTTLSKLPLDQRNHAKSIVEAYMGRPVANQQEHITHLHNYLQNDKFRSKVHAKLGFNEAQARASQNLARKTWNSLREIGANLHPNEVGIDPHQEANRVANWSKSLYKSESNALDQLGFSMSLTEVIDICKFLTHHDIDMSVVRQSILHTDGDPVQGVLQAYGLDNPEGREAFEGVKFLKLSKSEDFLKAPKEVIDIVGDAADMVKDAYAKNRVAPVKLGGKHSSGTYILQDEEGNNWLLKPGSSKNSPAAGVNETFGSQSRREACFYAVAHALGIKEVNPAWLLHIDSREVACIKMWGFEYVNLFKTVAEKPHLPQLALGRYLQTGDLFKWAVLDGLCSQSDRHLNNILVGSAEHGHPIALIDHGSAFAGYGFAPGHDKNTFVPGYLRAWSMIGFNNKSPEEKLKSMPQMSEGTDEEIKEWILSINPDVLQHIMQNYVMDPAPMLSRLAAIKRAVQNESSVSTALNKMWIGQLPWN